MGLLERLRPQPKWRHADAAIRAAGVAEIPAEEMATIIDLARHDPDPRVRRACVDRLEDPQVLAELARGDADAGIREAATQALVDTAIGEYEGASDASSLAALDGVTDVKALSEIAKRSAFEPVSRGAAARITDEKILASIARRAQHVSTRIDALARVTGADDLDAIALRTDFKDVALSALERIHERDRLEAIAERAKNKAASRAARTRVRELEEADRARAAEAEARRAEARRAVTAVCVRAEALGSERDPERLRRAIGEVEAEWAGLAKVDDGERDTVTTEGDLASRYARAIAAARGAIDDLERAEAARRERDQALAAGLDARTRLCERMEAMGANDVSGASAVSEASEVSDASGASGSDVSDMSEAAPRGDAAIDDQVSALEREWASLPAISGPDADVLEQRFARVSGAIADRRVRQQTHHVRRAQLEALVTEAEGLGLTEVVTVTVDDPAPLGARIARWKDIRREWLAAGSDVDAGLAERFQSLQTRIDEARTRVREAREARDRELVDRLRRDVDRLERQAAIQPLTLKLADRTVREVRAALDHSAIGRTAPKAHGELVARLKELQTTLTPKVNELRELDEWQRWANVEVQEKLCARVDALKDTPDLETVARELRTIQEEWRASAAVPRQHAQALWHRYKTAYDQVYARCEAYFAQQAEARTASLHRKEELCVRAEALAESRDWIATADQLKALQAEWKTIGAVPRGHEKAVWERFQKACDRFFTRRHEDLAQRKEAWAQNLARKEALSVRAEALAESTEWDTAAAEIKSLQNEWKTIGPVKKSRSDAIWQRFRAACDRFFERYKHRHQVELNSRIETREQLLVELDALTAEQADGTVPADLAVRVNSLYNRWLHAPPLPREHVEAAQQRFTTTLDRIISEQPAAFAGTPFDARANQRRLEQLCERIEKLVPSQGQAEETAASPAARLATMWREALAANTIGGRIDEDAKWRAAAEDVREVHAAWSRVGYVPHAVRTALAQRLERASRKVMELAGAAQGKRTQGKR